ncbi:hypothetical protein [Vulcanisaeta moutnovskia]|nr:hypothetical protein [Vulcanisaeta moutnovskia]
MSSFRKLSLMRVRELVIAVTVINNKRHILVNNETSEIVREVNRLLGLRRCSICGRWIKPEDFGYVEIVGNKVIKVVCQECLSNTYSVIAEVANQCLLK